MNDLSKTRIIILLTDSSQKVTDTEMQDAYDEFIRNIATIGSSKDNSNIFRMLNLTRIEIAPLKELYQCEYNPQNEAFAIPKRSVPIFGPLSKTKCLIFYKIRTAFRWTSNPL